MVTFYFPLFAEPGENCWLRAPSRSPGRGKWDRMHPPVNRPDYYSDAISVRIQHSATLDDGILDSA